MTRIKQLAVGSPSPVSICMIACRQLRLPAHARPGIFRARLPVNHDVCSFGDDPPLAATLGLHFADGDGGSSGSVSASCALVQKMRSWMLGGSGPLASSLNRARMQNKVAGGDTATTRYLLRDLI